MCFHFENKKIAILLDNLPAHKTDQVKKIVAETKMKLIFNLTHGSRLNPIEYFFGYLKDKLKHKTYRNFKQLA